MGMKQHHYAVPLVAPMFHPGYAGAYGGGSYQYGSGMHASGPPSKRPRNYNEEINTLAIVGLKEKSVTEEKKNELQDWFQKRLGFVMLQSNDRIGSLFVKFE